MGSLNRPISDSAARSPPIFASADPAWARTDQYSSPQALIKASRLRGSAIVPSAFAASSRVASSTSSSASSKSSKACVISSSLLIRVVRLSAVRIRPLAPYDQRLSPPSFHALIKRRGEIQFAFEIDGEREIKGEADEFVFSGLQPERPLIGRLKCVQ